MSALNTRSTPSVTISGMAGELVTTCGFTLSTNTVLMVANWPLVRGEGNLDPVAVEGLDLGR